MATQQDVFNEIQNIKNTIIAKGGTITQANKNVSLPELTAGVQSIPEGGGAGIVIIAAELADTTLELYGSNGVLIGSQSTGTGGMVMFTATEAGTYTVKASKGGTELWTNTITVDEIGVYNCKTGKALNNYTWAEIETAANGGYAEFMWSDGDYKDLTSFMGHTSTSYTRATIIGFNHDDLASESGKAGITFKLPYTLFSYKHWDNSNTNAHGISWIGSLIRSNCLKSNEDQYIYDTTVTSTTEGTYYTLNDNSETFKQVTLPTDYVEGKKYYSKTTLEADGAFIAGLPTDLSAVIKQVRKRTWGGLGGNLSLRNSIIIKTKDWLFLLADSEVYGSDKSKRCTTWYSKVGFEGKQYEYYKEYEEKKLRFGYTLWLRSPGFSSGNTFCISNIDGYVDNYTADTTFKVALCFCV